MSERERERKGKKKKKEFDVRSAHPARGTRECTRERKGKAIERLNLTEIDSLKNWI